MVCLMEKVFGFDYMHDGGPFRSSIEVFRESPTCLIVRMTDATDANRMSAFGPWELEHLKLSGVIAMAYADSKYEVTITTAKEEQMPDIIEWLLSNYEKNKCVE